MADGPRSIPPRQTPNSQGQLQALPGPIMRLRKCPVPYRCHFLVHQSCLRPGTTASLRVPFAVESCYYYLALALNLFSQHAASITVIYTSLCV